MNPIDRVIALLKDPNEVWLFDEHSARHQKTGVEIWTANGFWFVDLFSPSQTWLSFAERWRLWRAVRVAQRNALNQKLSKT